MVRVISVHHFVSQDIHTCEDPVAAVVAPPERLLLALPQHVIEVRDLARGGDVSFTFPSVDQVHHMLHCCNGNYVATLETKQTRQGQETMYARIYANWDVMTQVQQPMRARIAGRVTPSSAQSGPPSLEMIELPLKRTPHIIACCQSTGNLLVASHCNLILYHYVVRTHDISRLRFLDFEEAGFSVELSFRPTWMSLAEDFVMTGSRERVHLFQFVYKDVPNSHSTGQQKHDFRTRNPSPGTSKGRDNTINDDNNNNNSSNRKTCIDLDAILSGQLSANDVRLHPYSFPIVVELPSIAAERAANSVSPSSSGSSPSTSVATQRQSPFQIASSDMTVTIKYANSAAPPWTKIREVVHLLQLQIIGTPQQANGILYTENHDEFRGVIMKPIYLSAHEKLLEQRKNSGSDHNPLHSCHFGMLASIECIVVTQQEGYHYHFSLLEHNEQRSKTQQSACVTIYPFTAHVQGIAMERFFLHALTETGLETYTVRVGHHLAAELGIGGAVVCPSVAEPICLVGLRPFLGVEHLLLAESHIVLLACSEGSSLSSQDSQGGGGWTLYSLALPHPSACYRDMFAVGSVHRWTSPTTYSHLLGEGHMLLRVALNTIAWHPGGASESTVPAELDPVERNRLEGLYQESCALLADYHISCETEEDWKLARPYYIMAGLTPIQVVERVSNMKVEFEGDTDTQKKKYHLHGLIVYLRQSLIALGHETGDILFSPTLPSFAHTLLDLFEELDPSQVSTIVLHSSLLRECATDRVLGIMKKQLKTRAIPETTDALALVLLCIQKGSPDQAMAVLQSLSSSGVNNILLENPTLLIESGSPNVPSSLSELAALLMDSKPIVLASVLKQLVTKTNLYTLEQVLKMFMDYIPSRIGISGSSASKALQLFLEHYFAWYFSTASGKLEYTAATTEALKILVRSYLSDLQRYELTPTGLKRELHDPNGENNEKVLCEDHRFEYLSKMPPFAPDLSHKLISLQEGSSSDDTKSTSKTRNKDIPNYSLFKLQCLLSYAQLPHECLVEVHKCVQTNPRLYGSLSLQVLCVPTREAVSILLDFCPQAALQFAKERFVNETEWKYLVFLLHRKVQSLGDENVLKPFYMQIRKDVLTHLAQTVPLEVMGRVLPPGEESTYHAYMQICQQVTHANHIRALIMATGQQLLSTLNLLIRIQQETGLTNKTELLKRLSTIPMSQIFPTGDQTEL